MAFFCNEGLPVNVIITVFRGSMVRADTNHGGENY
jgi:hypothetical protein